MKVIATILAACCLIGCTVTTWIDFTDFTTAGEKAWLYRVYYGYRGDKIVFVSFESGQTRAPSLMKIQIKQSPSGNSMCAGTINLPDGRKFNVTSANKGFEYINGTVTEFDLTMTKTDLDDFLKSKQERYTYTEFRKFMRQKK